jgi:REP element-mobilizing transposase RayT
MLANSYRRDNNVVFYYIIWCPKYRSKVLVGAVETRLEVLVYEISSELKVEVIGDRSSNCVNALKSSLDC